MSSELRKAAEVYGNKAVHDLAGAAAPAAAKIEQDGLSNTERKTFRAESAQIRAQQGSTGSTRSQP